MGSRPLALASPAFSLLIKVTGGPHKGESFTITKQPFSIGRNADNDVVLPNDSKISRNHVTVNKRESSFVIENLSKRNPILQDNQPKSKIELYSGQKFQIGESELEFNWGDPQVKKTEPAKPNLANQNITNQNITNQSIANQSVARNQNINPAYSNNLAIPRNVSNIPVQSGNKKINITINQNYEQLNNHSSAKKKTRKAQPQNKSFLIILAVVGVLVLFLMPDKDSAKKAKKNNLRSSEEIQKTLETSKLNIESYQKEKRIQGDGSIDKQYESSQSYYVRGFRDYRQGQYSRAIQAFQAALSFDPNHTLARKYLNFSLKKLDELVQFNINQGRRYREKSNYRLCKSAFQQVMIIKKDPNDKVYKEAKQLFDECDTLHKGRY
jgi:tetratricopeptide (TPR) repeat protein